MSRSLPDMQVVKLEACACQQNKHLFGGVHFAGMRQLKTCQATSGWFCPNTCIMKQNCIKPARRMSASLSRKKLAQNHGQLLATAFCSGRLHAVMRCRTEKYACGSGMREHIKAWSDSLQHTPRPQAQADCCSRSRLLRATHIACRICTAARLLSGYRLVVRMRAAGGTASKDDELHSVCLCTWLHGEVSMLRLV